MRQYNKDVGFYVIFGLFSSKTRHRVELKNGKTPPCKNKKLMSQWRSTGRHCSTHSPFLRAPLFIYFNNQPLNISVMRISSQQKGMTAIFPATRSHQKNERQEKSGITNDDHWFQKNKI